MIVIKTIAEMRQLRKDAAGSVGFVPTMGFLHEGHISLVKRAKKENAVVVVSIFVNPAQFGPREDFKKYPRDIKRDLALLEPLTDIVFMPSTDEMYPKNYSSWVEVQDITEELEGAARPGHFRGVSTIVNKLFNIVEPTKAYFGQKDAQQVAVIKKMVRDLNMNLQVVACPTVREKDGLAMSSRNTYLTSEQRRAAPVLYKALMLAKELAAQGEKDAGVLRHEMTELIEKESLADIEYISVADNETLKEIHRMKLPALVSMAVKFGKTRLIDNIVLNR
ncbi:MAG: pantoate--beta-alanine ligase [Chloroflexi bacterium RBG_13_51_52]|nr:MAG: pantoate--beta-alanine ligase [Chloroflexi bacterium RBG_13_51_52]